MRIIISFCAVVLATSVRAEVPRVAVDIAPVHGLVSQVMGGLGAPDLIIPLGASPHGYAMRPSEARSLAQADVVFWIGPEFTPWMVGPLDTLAPNARKVGLMAAPGVALLPYRTGAGFDPHDHAGEHGHDDHADKHGHDDHADTHGHDEHADTHEGEHAHEEHEGEHEGEHAHDEHADAHGAMDTHLWLDPQNAALWLDVIAAELSRLDPANAGQYAENAQTAQAELAQVTEDISAKLSALESKPFIVFHDSYHYFEARFGLEAVAAITLGDAGTASAARLAEVREVVAETGAACALAEPRQSKGLIDAVGEGDEIRVIPLDAVGVNIPLGAGFYATLLKQVSDGLSRCMTK